MTLLTNAELSPLFRERVDAALRAHGTTPSPGLRDYLTGVLLEQALASSKQALLDRPVSLQMFEALDAPVAERLSLLQRLGDEALYLVSFFRDHLARRRLDDAYVEQIAAQAYHALASTLRAGDGRRGGSVFQELSMEIHRWVAVLRTVSEAFLVSSARTASDLVRIYERWQQTGSSTLAQGLSERGLVPVRNLGGIH